jgi:hypothetical protein
LNWSSVFNDMETLPNTDAGKLRLSDLTMATWVDVGKTPQDLQIVHVVSIQNPNAMNAMKQVWQRMGLNEGAGVTVKSTGTDQELNSFNLLLGSPFGLAATKMSQSFQMGKTITQFHISGSNIPNSGPNMDIIFG